MYNGLDVYEKYLEKEKEDANGRDQNERTDLKRLERHAVIDSLR